MTRGSEATPQGRERVFALTVSAVLIALVLLPVVRWKDSFPLSNYPMFSRKKGKTAKVFHVVAFSETGNHRPLPPEMLGTDEIMQAYVTAKIAIGGGRETASELCERAARLVAADEDYADVTTLDVRTDWFHAVKYWQGARKPLRSVVSARCEVQRSAAGEAGDDAA